MINSILNKEEIKSEFSFILSNKSEDRYFCSCGQQFTHQNDEEITSLQTSLQKESDFDDEFSAIYKDIKLSLDNEISCSNCYKNFSSQEARMKLSPIDSGFISGFEFEENNTDLFIYSSNAYSALNVHSKDGEVTYEIDIKESVKYIRFEKETKKLFYKDSGEEEEFDLNQVIEYINKFFDDSSEKVINFYRLHMYINRLANFVSDTRNGNIVHEFLENIRKNNSDSGISYIKKLLSIFYGIIKYSNLSTIALTKSSQFLYELMLECEIPSSVEMIESGATSPVNIFNFLVGKYISKINEEVNEENKEVHEFKFKSKSRVEFENQENKNEDDLSFKIKDEETEANYSISVNKVYKSSRVINDEGVFRVLDAVEDGAISKFIYKKIDNFTQYKQIIKFFKFYDKAGIINLLQKYDLDLLTNAIDVIYFRSEVPQNEMNRILSIIDSFVEGRFFVKDYRNVSKFSFIEYDDARLMMSTMDFDPNKHFNKIKTYDALVEYHDNLVKFYRVKSEIENSGGIDKFVSKFRYLETRGENDYNGPIEIHLFDTAGRIMKEGPEMSHSGSEYAANVANGTYLMGSVFDRDPNRPEKEIERYTIGFKYEEKYNDLVFDQIKGFANKIGSDRFKRLVMEFLVEKDVTFQPIRDLRIKGDDGVF